MSEGLISYRFRCRGNVSGQWWMGGRSRGGYRQIVGEVMFCDVEGEGKVS